MSEKNVVDGKAKPSRSDARDQRVSALLKLKTLEERLRFLFALVVDEQVDQKSFIDLVMILTNQAALSELVNDLAELVRKYGKPTPDAGVMQKSFRKLTESLPDMCRRLEGAVRE